MDASFSQEQPLLKRLWTLLDDFVRHSYEAEEPVGMTCRSGRSSFPGGPRINRPLSSETVRTEDLPERWDWRDVHGKNYLSWTVNQHIPQYCGSCWAQGPTAALADRFIIADPVRFANMALSPQVVLNCRAGGSCHGGNPGAVFEFAYSTGVRGMSVYICIDFRF